MLELLSFKHENITKSLQTLFKSSGMLAKLCDLVHNELMTANHTKLMYKNSASLEFCEEKISQIIDVFSMNVDFKEYFFQDLLGRAKATFEKIRANDFKVLQDVEIKVLAFRELDVPNILDPFNLIFLTNKLIKGG